VMEALRPEHRLACLSVVGVLSCHALFLSDMDLA
jgi:hypothetical protein